jgi:hypothetical protein
VTLCPPKIQDAGASINVLKMKEVTGSLRNIHNEGQRNLYSSHYFHYQQIKKGEARGYVACLKDIRNAQNISSETLKVRDRSKDLGISWRTVK